MTALAIVAWAALTLFCALLFVGLTASVVRGGQHLWAHYVDPEPICSVCGDAKYRAQPRTVHFPRWTRG